MGGNKSSDLAILENIQVVPKGWWIQMEPKILALEESQISYWEKRLNQWVIEVSGNDTSELEFQKLLRVLDKRKGELLATNGQSANATGTETRLRTIHNHWKLLRKHIFQANKVSLVTRSHLLKLIAENVSIDPDTNDAVNEKADLRHGDFRERLKSVPDASVDLLITDPPYPASGLELWSDLSKCASRILKPRGLLFAWSGTLFLPEIIRRLESHLTYGWTFALMLPGSGSRIMGRHMIQGWKPILAFSTGTWPSGKWADDILISKKRDKTEFLWKQNIEPAKRIIERFTPKDALVVDPFMGVGTFGLASIETKRKFIGVELDSRRFAKSREILNGI